MKCGKYCNVIARHSTLQTLRAEDYEFRLLPKAAVVGICPGRQLSAEKAAATKWRRLPRNFETLHKIGVAAAPAWRGDLIHFGARRVLLDSTTPAPATPVPAPSPIRRLDDDEVAMLEERGQQLMTIGAVAAARLMLRRAAESGSPHAALNLGATYDPTALLGIKPDACMARTWYEKARQFGSSEAAHRLELLTNQYPE
jgi:TPR repeat protein